MNSFDSWNSLKKSLNESISEKEKFPEEGEVWMCHLGNNIGFEQNGSGEDFSRPVLIIKKFNYKMFWSVPLSTKQKDLNFYYNYTDPHGNKVSAILAQMKLLSTKRLRRKMYTISETELEEIKKKLRKLIE
jgi:mRNA interferase MazF